VKWRLPLVVGLVLVLSILFAGQALADPPDPFDPSFESGDLSGWNVDAAPDAVGVSSGDGYATPLYGNYMAVLGTPGQYDYQPMGVNKISQVFQAVSKVIQFAINIFTFDYTGWDLFGGKLSVVDTGEVIVEEWQTAWGPVGDTSLKTTGWQEITIDVSGYAGQTLKLEIGCGGTGDTWLGTWCYFDGPPPPVEVDYHGRRVNFALGHNDGFTIQPWPLPVWGSCAGECANYDGNFPFAAFIPEVDYTLNVHYPGAEPYVAGVFRTSKSGADIPLTLWLQPGPDGKLYYCNVSEGRDFIMTDGIDCQ